MDKLRFIENSNITVTLNNDNYVKITPDQLTPELIEMISKQIYPSVDLLLHVFIKQSSKDPENEISIITESWDGICCSKVIGRHTNTGEYTKVDYQVL